MLEGELETLDLLSHKENCFMFTKLKDIAFFPADEEAQERKGGSSLSVRFSVFTMIDKTILFINSQSEFSYNRS